MKKELIVYIVIIAAVSIFSCKKSLNYEQIRFVNAVDVSNMKDWLEKQKNTSSSITDKAWTDSVIYLINWKAAQETDFGTHERLIVVPVGNLQIKRNISGRHLYKPGISTVNEVVFIEDRFGKIRKGNIVQVTPVKNKKEINVIDVIKNIYNDRSIDFNGVFTVLSIHKNILFELKYENNKKSTFASLQPGRIDVRGRFIGKISIVLGDKNIQNGQPKKELTDELGGGCVNVYLLTYSYNDYGITAILDIEYLYSYGPGCTYNTIGPPDQGYGLTINDSINLVDVLPIKNQISIPCMDSALKTLGTGNIKNVITDYFHNSYQGYGVLLDITIRDSSFGTDTTYAQSIVSATDPQQWIVYLNSDKMNSPYNISQEMWGQIIMHELAHAYIYSYGNDVFASNYDHFAIFSKFTTPFSSILQDAFGMDAASANMLALSGIRDLWQYTDFDHICDSVYHITGAQIDSTISAYSRGTSGTKCGH